MEPNLPRCGRQAWDSAKPVQGPSTLPALNSEDSGPWPLLFYPKLGQLSWDDEDFNRELLCRPCGLLSGYCQRHRPRSRSPSGRGRATGPDLKAPRPASSQRSPAGQPGAGRPRSPLRGRLGGGGLPEDSSERHLPPAQRSLPSSGLGPARRGLGPRGR